MLYLIRRQEYRCVSDVDAKVCTEPGFRVMSPSLNERFWELPLPWG
jgi:hypothetical protein